LKFRNIFYDMELEGVQGTDLELQTLRTVIPLDDALHDSDTHSVTAESVLDMDSNYSIAKRLSISYAAETMRNLAVSLSPRSGPTRGVKNDILYILAHSKASHAATNSTHNATIYNSQISTCNMLMEPYTSSHRKRICARCCRTLAKILCNAWCCLVTVAVFLSIISVGYQVYVRFIATDEFIIEISPALYIGVFVVIGLCGFACCCVCSWLSVDNLIRIKRNESRHIGDCCDVLFGRDKDKYYKLQWNELLECNKVDYFVNFHGKQYGCKLHQNITKLIYDYNGKDYVDLNLGI